RYAMPTDSATSSKSTPSMGWEAGGAAGGEGAGRSLTAGVLSQPGSRSRRALNKTGPHPRPLPQKQGRGNLLLEALSRREESLRRDVVCIGRVSREVGRCCHCTVFWVALQARRKAVKPDEKTALCEARIAARIVRGRLPDCSPKTEFVFAAGL